MVHSPEIIRGMHARLDDEREQAMVDPGEGYRLLGREEIIKDGDEHMRADSGEWLQTFSAGRTVGSQQSLGRIKAYRRRKTTTLEVSPGDGYRWLKDDETLQQGDEFLEFGVGDWVKTDHVGRSVSDLRRLDSSLNYRRKCIVDSSPEDDSPTVVPMSIQERAALSVAIGKYLRSADAFSEASSDFTASCRSLREKMKPNQQFVCEIDFKHYLVNTDKAGNFDVSPIQSI